MNPKNGLQIPTVAFNKFEAAMLETVNCRAGTQNENGENDIEN